MTRRIDKSWLVFTSIENVENDRCVDFFSRPDGTFGFEEFRRDPEDRGAWTPVAFYSGRAFAQEQHSVEAAMATVPWLAAVLDAAPSPHKVAAAS